jgi:hypothetical protein
MGWIGVDLDGTLAEYSGWVAPDHIGKPIPKMASRIKEWLAEGKDVRILTARANKKNPDSKIAVPAIKVWCKKHLGKALPVTCEKDLAMVELWDDRCVQVIPNTGERVDGR